MLPDDSNVNPPPEPEKRPSSSGKYLDADTWDALKSAGFSEQELYEDQPTGPIIFSYTRKQAIEDGVLIDLTRPGFARLLKLTGIRVHTAITATAFGAAVGCPFDAEHADQVIGRVLIVLAAFGKAAQKQRESDRVHFTVDGPSGQAVAMWALIGPGDDGEPVLTLMLEGED